MKLPTLGLLATLSMAVTSASVWALVPPDEAQGAGDSPIAAGAGNGGGGSADGGGLAELLSQAKTGPSFTVGDTVVMEGRVGHAVMDAQRDTDTFLYLDLKPQADEVASIAAPVNLAIVLDRSRSMEGKRMDNALAAARGMIRRLRDGDTVSLVAYNTTTETLVAPTTIDARTRDDLLFGLRGLQARGHTCISCGLEAAMELQRQRSGAVNRILLLSDGEANTGVRDVDGFRRIAVRARDMETSISSIGVDVEYNERVMFAVAQASNGRHYFVENPSALPRIFDDELQSLVRSVAAGAQVEVDLAPGVQVLEVLSRDTRRDGNRLLVNFGTLTAAESKTLLVRLRVSKGAEGDRPIADVRLRYANLATGKPGEASGTLVAHATTDAAKLSPLDPFVEARVGRAETAAAVERANELFSAGDFAGARRTLDENKGRLRRRKSEASRRVARPKAKKRIDDDFKSQIGTLQEAEDLFGNAQQQEPNAPAQSRAGKGAVRSNAGKLDDLGL